MKRLLLIPALLVLAHFLSACAVVHRYPAYRGKVLELGTDQPIEGAGVLAVYWMNTYTMPESNSRYVGYQAVLTDNAGRFEVPSKIFTDFYPMAMYDSNVGITIYKYGYGNFPGSTNPARPKHVTTDPPVGAYIPPMDKEIIFRLPKLETEDEISEHGKRYVPLLPLDADYLPDGMMPEQFGLHPGNFKKKGDQR